MMDSWMWTSRSATGFYSFEATDSSVILRSNGQAGKKRSGGVKRVLPHERFLGKRLRLNAQLRVKGEEASAGLWLTASRREWHLTDGMYDRLLRETEGLVSESLVIDVPTDTEYLSYGIWMIGDGECEMLDPCLSIVNQSVAVTASQFYDYVGKDKWIERVAQ
jgi:hypothetical protein